MAPRFHSFTHVIIIIFTRTVHPAITVATEFEAALRRYMHAFVNSFASDTDMDSFVINEDSVRNRD